MAHRPGALRNWKDIPISMRFARFLFCFAALAFAVQAADAAKKSALDKPTLEAYIRHVELLPDDLKINVGDPKPSLFADFLEVPVQVETPTGVYAIRYFVSKDGQRIVKGSMFDVSKNPFQSELDKIKTDLQPSFGEPGAPVVMVVFTDFECPNCREEAKVLRENLQKALPQRRPCLFQGFSSRANAPVGHEGGDRGPVRVPAVPRRVLGISRLDFRAPARNHLREHKGQNRRVGWDKEPGYTATRPLHRFEGDGEGYRAVDCRGPRAAGEWDPNHVHQRPTAHGPDPVADSRQHHQARDRVSKGVGRRR